MWAQFAEPSFGPFEMVTGSELGTGLSCGVHIQ